MEYSELYNVIFKRKSIRKYDLKILDSDTLLKVSRQIDNVKAIFPEIKTEIKITIPQEVKGFIQVKAPHYIVAFSEKKEGYLTNIGFMLQQMDLFFAANGLGCCWQGWPKPTKEIRSDKNLEFVIVLAFGLPKEKLYRDSVSQFKRKSLNKITDLQIYEEIIETARLAPSPSQPWYFTGDNKTIDICCIKSESLISKMSKTFSLMEERLKMIEIGITTCHLWIAFLHFNKKVEFIIKSDQLIKVPENYFYVISINILKTQI